jgi:hypothetical protein
VLGLVQVFKDAVLKFPPPQAKPRVKKAKSKPRPKARKKAAPRRKKPTRRKKK